MRSGLTFTHRRGSRRALATLALVAVVALLAGQVGALARLQAALDGPSPATGHAQVVAHGVAGMPAERIAWRAVRDTAEPLEVAEPEDRALGFALADEEGITVNDVGFGTQTRLAPGEATFVPNGAFQQRPSNGDADVTYYRLALVAESEASDAGGDDLLFAGDGFDAPGGNRDIDLVRDVLEDDEQSQINGGDFPVMVLATAGEIEVDAGDDPVTLAAGEGAQVTGDLTISGVGQGTAAFVVAVIGPEVPAPPRFAGTIALGVYACAADVTGDDLGDAIDPDGVEACEPVESGVDIPLVDAAGEEIAFEDAVADGDEAGVYVWGPLPFGDYAVGEPNDLPTGYGDLRFYDVDGNLLESGDVSISRDTPDVRINLYLISSPAGTITVRTYGCPEGMTAETLAGDFCELVTEGFDFEITGETLEAALTVEDAEVTTGGVYRFTGLTLDSGEPDGTGAFEFNLLGLADPYIDPVLVGTGSEGPVEAIGFELLLSPDEPDAEIAIYAFLPAGEAGNITLDAVVCPAADSPAEECTAGAAAGAGVISGILITGPEGVSLTEENAFQEGGSPLAWADQLFGDYVLDASGFVVTDGYEVARTELTPDGADPTAGFSLSADVPAANIVVVLIESGGEPEPTPEPVDGDEDGLSDEDEASAGTDPADPDSDDDCHSDGSEVAAETSPTDPASLPDGECDVAV